MEKAGWKETKAVWRAADPCIAEAYGEMCSTNGIFSVESKGLRFEKQDQLLCSNVDVLGGEVGAVCSEESTHVLCVCVDGKRQQESEFGRS